jgi:hypothetical protein
MSLQPYTPTELNFPSRPFRGREGVSIAVLALLLGTLPQCAPWDDEPPPATASAVASSSSSSPPGAPPADPGARLPPGGPIPPAGQAAAAADDNEAKYASGEYAIGSDTDSYDDNDPSALKDFRQPLDPYGTWVDDPTYGTVWIPSPGVVGGDFQPYVSAGHWAYDDDYVWVSDYPWGWAPFHYGRWVFVEGRGWCWIPGREYRGAWVTWSVDDGYSYLGWAPMGPEFIWFGGVAVGFHGYWGPRWAYCPRGDVFAPRVGAHVVVGPGAVAIAGRMRPYAAANVRVGGPPPARLGYTATQLPHATAVASVSRAQQYARPSTARPLGATAPARFEAAPATNAGRQPAVSGVHSTPGVSTVPRGGVGAPNVGRVQAAPVQGRATPPAVAPAPAPARGTYHAAPGGAWHAGGGGHHH